MLKSSKKEIITTTSFFLKFFLFSKYNFANLKGAGSSGRQFVKAALLKQVKSGGEKKTREWKSLEEQDAE